MFKISLNASFRLQGCPETGAEAILWREEHGLVGEPTSIVRVGLSLVDRDFCLRDGVSGSLDAGADLDLYKSSDSLCGVSTPFELSRDLYPEIPLEVVRLVMPGSTPTSDDLLRVWGALLDAEAPRRDRIRERLNEIEALPDDLLGEQYVYYSGANVPEWIRVANPDLYERILRAAKAVIEKRRQAEEEARELHAREKAAAEAARAKEIAEWTEKFGSKRLRRCCDEGIECSAIYRSERLAFEYPGWRVSDKVRGGGYPPRNPPEAALAMIDEARASSPLAAGATLEYWVAEEKWSTDGDHVDEWRGYVAVIHDERLGWIVWGGPR